MSFGVFFYCIDPQINHVIIGDQGRDPCAWNVVVYLLQYIEADRSVPVFRGRMIIRKIYSMGKEFQIQSSLIIKFTSSFVVFLALVLLKAILEVYFRPILYMVMGFGF